MGQWSSKPVKLDPIAFDGDNITFTVKRLLVPDMMVLNKYIVGDKLAFSAPLEMVNVATEILPKYVIGIDGMTADGEAVTPEQFINSIGEFYFVPLIGQLFTALIAASTVGQQTKNSAPPSPNSSEV